MRSSCDQVAILFMVQLHEQFVQFVPFLSTRSSFFFDSCLLKLTERHRLRTLRSFWAVRRSDLVWTEAGWLWLVRKGFRLYGPSAFASKYHYAWSSTRWCFVSACALTRSRGIGMISKFEIRLLIQFSSSISFAELSSRQISRICASVAEPGSSDRQTYFKTIFNLSCQLSIRCTCSPNFGKCTSWCAGGHRLPPAS